MRKIVKKTGTALGILAGGILLGTLLLIAVFLLPEEVMQRNLKESVPALTEYIGMSEMLVGYQATYDGIFTDAIMLQNAVYDEGHTLLEKAMGIYRNGFENGIWIPRDALVDYLNGEVTPDTSVEYHYARYWHGYLVVLKPLLLLFDWGEIQFF